MIKYMANDEKFLLGINELINNNNIQYVKNIHNKFLKDAIIFFADDRLIQENTSWSGRTYEKIINGTQIGGSQYYENIKTIRRTKDLENLQVYLLGLKLGFVGQKNYPDIALIEEICAELNVKPTYLGGGQILNKPTLISLFIKNININDLMIFTTVLLIVVSCILKIVRYTLYKQTIIHILNKVGQHA